MYSMRILLGLLCAFVAVPAFAQPRPGTLRVVVRDATDLTIPAATVAITSSTGVVHSMVSNERGEALFEALSPGEYVAHVESPGFTPQDVKDLRVRAGAQTSRNIVMEIAGLAEEIEVLPPEEDTQLMAAFTEQLTAEQLAALPDDPDELAQVLQQIVGENADIRVNGFSGGRLPPGTQIQEVRVTYDDASGSGNGGPRIEVRTRPGSGRWRNSFNMNMRNDALNARNPFSGERPSGQTRQYAWNADGPLVRNRTGISVSIDRNETQEQQAVRAARLEGIYSALVAQPSTRTGVEVELEHALTNAQELRAEINYRRGHSLNQGVSEFDLPERAFSRIQSDGEVRIGHRATIRRKWVNQLRFQYRMAELRERIDQQRTDDPCARRLYDRRRANQRRPAHPRFSNRERARVHREARAPDGIRHEHHRQQLRGGRSAEYQRHLHFCQPRDVPGRHSDDLHAEDHQS